MKITEITPFIGAEVSGVTYKDLSSDAAFDQLIATLRERELVVVRQLELAPEEQVELAKKVGPPIPFVQERYRHPEFEVIMISSNEKRDNKPIGVARVGNFWHQDSTYIAEPPPYTMLHGVNVPQTSGHTLYASAIDVYDRLPAEWKKKVKGRTGIHTVAKRQRIRAEHAGLSIAEYKALVEHEYPPVRHPLVKTDPTTGRDYIYGAPEYMQGVEGFDANETEAFFNLLDSLIQDPAHVYTHRWTPKDLVIWKTQTTYHSATDIEPGVGRTVHRISIGDDATVAA